MLKMAKMRGLKGTKMAYYATFTTIIAVSVATLLIKAFLSIFNDSCILQLPWLTLKCNQSENTTRFKIMIISTKKSLILTSNSENFSYLPLPLSGDWKLLVSDGPLRGTT